MLFVMYRVRWWLRGRGRVQGVLLMLVVDIVRVQVLQLWECLGI